MSGAPGSFTNGTIYDTIETVGRDLYLKALKEIASRAAT
jgi:hypothetical protein